MYVLTSTTSGERLRMTMRTRRQTKDLPRIAGRPPPENTPSRRDAIDVPRHSVLLKSELLLNRDETAGAAVIG